MMTEAALGACEWFVWDLRRSNLVERGRLDQLVSDFMAHHPQSEPPQLAEYLVNQTILTRFQADSLLSGKNQGLVLGPYVVQDTLGTGSMGTVYKAVSKANNEWYAVKVLPRRSMWNIRLARRKVRDFEQIQQPAVVPFTDVGTAGSMHYLVWPYVEGEPLSKVMEKKGRLPHAEAALVAMQTAEGLEPCHQKGIIHGLLKPSNLFMTKERQVKILDFGIGALLAETENESVVDTMSTANTMASGLDCASPEGIMDPTQMTPASDQYSLGCILYYCLTGQFPYPGSNAVEKMMAHQTKQPTPLKELAPETPEELVAVVEQLMQKDPGQRFGSISEAIGELKPWAEEAKPPPPVKLSKSRLPGQMKPTNGQSSPQTNGHAVPKAAPARPSGAGLPLPDRRLAEVPNHGVAAHGSVPARPSMGDSRLPGLTPINMSSTGMGHSAVPPMRPAPQPLNRSALRAGPAVVEESRGIGDKISIILIVVLALAACVAGWYLAAYFQ